MNVGGRYNWRGQTERLVYVGRSGVWYQFAKVESHAVWCEVLEIDLVNIEESNELGETNEH